MAKFQRCEYNRLNVLSQDEKTVLTLTIDMAQNLEVPHFGSNQPGDSYYLSPLIVYVFGVVNNATDFMHAFVWNEGDGDRGMNNIVSCLHKYLSIQNIFSKKNKYKELVILADNCGGQNKNRCLIRYLLWLVESGYLSTTKLIFLIKGHTKNKCDRLFNLLKSIYRRVDLYSFKESAAILNLSSKDISVIPMSPKDFFDVNRWLSQYYLEPETKTINEYHQFIVEKENPTTLRRYIYCGSKEFLKQDFLPKRGDKVLCPNIRKNKLSVTNMRKELNKLEPPGIRPMKQMEMYQKWRKIVPDMYWADTCPEPTEEIKDYVKSRKEERKVQKREEKRMSLLNKRK